MKIVDVEQIIKDVKAAIDLIDKEKLDTSGRAELETILKLLESAPEVTDVNVGKTQLSEEGATFEKNVNVGDTISRQAVKGMLENHRVDFSTKKDYRTARACVNAVPHAELKRETTTVSIGRTRGSVTMWYECNACGKPVDQEDAFCSRCGRKLIHE